MPFHLIFKETNLKKNGKLDGYYGEYNSRSFSSVSEKKAHYFDH